MADNPKTVDDNRPGDAVGVNDLPTPNDSKRPPGTVVDWIVVHADASRKAQNSVDWIRADESDVSYHTLVERDGDVDRFTPPEEKAWHAGKGTIGDRDNPNVFTLGISLSNRNDGVEEYPELQLQVAAAEVAGWIRLKEKNGIKFNLSVDRITDHATIRNAWLKKHPGTADIKTDPGPKFPMAKFKEYVQKTLDGVKV